MIQRCLAIFTRDFTEVFSGNLDSQYFVGSDSFLGHSIKSHSSGRGTGRFSSRWGGRYGGVMVKSAPTPSFIVAQPQLLLEFLVVTLDDPAVLGNLYQRLP